MKKLRILIDIDGIVADTMPHWLQYLGDQTGVYAKMEDITMYDLSRCPPLTEIGPGVVFGVLQDVGFTMGIPMMEGAANVLKNLMDDGHEVYLVTARSGAQHIAETYEWVKATMPFIDTRRQLIFCYEKHLIACDVIIDDQAATLQKYKTTHPKALALGIRYLYNDHLDCCSNPVDVTLVEYGDTAWATLYQQIMLHAEEP
jgi:5'(3')-deoxyribonucleotidase